MQTIIIQLSIAVIVHLGGTTLRVTENVILRRVLVQNAKRIPPRFHFIRDLIVDAQDLARDLEAVEEDHLAQ